MLQRRPPNLTIRCILTTMVAVLASCTSAPVTQPSLTTQPSPATQASVPAPRVAATPPPVQALAVQPPPPRANSQEYANFNTGEADNDNVRDKTIEWVPVIAVTSPAYGSDIKGKVQVSFRAPGMTRIKVACWQQPTPADPNPWGHDATVAQSVPLNEDGEGSFVFPADDFPNGPLVVRIYAQDDARKRDLCQLQLFNTGGVSWKQGIPKNDPPAAAGMKLVFADDFDTMPKISRDGKNATYQCHKTGGGDFSGWPFSDNSGAANPFSQVGTYLRIHASKPPGTRGSTGILSSAHEGGVEGIYAQAPCYFECRFLAQSAPGTWPAFWLLTKECLTGKNHPCDELDIIEAYGGLGRKNPNFPNYAVTSHYWSQKDADGKSRKADHMDVPMMDLGGKSTWSATFHTYAVKITKTDTIYYFDDIEAYRHPTNEVSAREPFWFLINYAIGGISGWHIDLERYGNSSDMYVDYVRVYAAEAK